MKKKHDVKATVVSIKKKCGSNMQVGDSFSICRKDGYGLTMENAEGWCPELIQTALGPMNTLAFGGTLPWEDEEGRAKSACPDPECCVVVAVERINE